MEEQMGSTTPITDTAQVHHFYNNNPPARARAANVPGSHGSAGLAATSADYAIGPATNCNIEQWLDDFLSSRLQPICRLEECIRILRIVGCGLLVMVLVTAPGAAMNGDNMRDRVRASHVHLLWDDEDVLALEGGMSVDADGAPRAYSPIAEEGLDALEHAGSPEHWDGIATTQDGEPILQGPGDPAPGYYVSTTALEDHFYARENQKRYVDASVVPYIALPATEDGPQLGDLALVLNTHTGKISPAIFADISDIPGEGSIALAERLDINSDARRGGTDRGVVYIVFKNSGIGAVTRADEMADRVQELWSGPAVQKVWDELCSQHPEWPCGEVGPL
jgi:hypothetical protein